MDDRQEGQVGRNIKYRQSHRQVIDSLWKGASKQRVKERGEIVQDGTGQEERKGRLVCMQTGPEGKQKEMQKGTRKRHGEME